MAVPPTPPAGVLLTPQQEAEARRQQQEFFDFITKAGDAADSLYEKYGSAARLIIGLEAIQKAKDTELYRALYGQMERASQVPRQLAAEITNSSVLASEGISSTSKAFMDALYKDQQFLANETVVTYRKLDESTDNVIKETKPKLATFFKDAKELGQAFFDSALSETRLYMAAIRDSAEEDGARMREITALTNKGLGVDVTTLRALYQEEFSKTGKATGEFVEKFSATIMAASDATGLSSKQIAFDLSRAAADVEKFGNSSYSQIAALSVPIRKLGLDMQDVSDVVGKFMRFEDATQAVSNFAAVTGASLDTMDLFYKANSGDKLAFFQSLKQQLTDQGVAIENLTHQEQVYLAKGMGLNLRQFQSFMREDADITSEMLDEMIEENAQKTEYTGKDLADKLAQTGGLAQQTLDAMKPENIKETAEVIRALTGGTMEFAEAYNKFGENLLGIAHKALPQFATAGTEMSDKFVEGVGKMEQKWKDFEKYIDDKLKDGAFHDLVEYIKETFGPKSVPKAWQPLTNGLQFTAEAVSSIATYMGGNIEKNLTEAQAKIVASTTTAIENAATSWTDLLAKNAADQEKINAAMTKAKDEQGNLQRDFQKVATSARDLKMSGYTAEQIKGALKKDFSDKDFGSLSKAEFDAIFAAITDSKATGISEALPKLIEARNAKILSEFQGATPVAPTTPGPTTEGASAAGGTTPGTAAPAAPAAKPATAQPQEYIIRLALDVDQGELSRLINLKLVDAASAGIEIPMNTPNINGAGKMRILLEEGKP